MYLYNYVTTTYFWTSHQWFSKFQLVSSMFLVPKLICISRFFCFFFFENLRRINCRQLVKWNASGVFRWNSGSEFPFEQRQLRLSWPLHPDFCKPRANQEWVEFKDGGVNLVSWILVAFFRGINLLKGQVLLKIMYKSIYSRSSCVMQVTVLFL